MTLVSRRPTVDETCCKTTRTLPTDREVDSLRQSTPKEGAAQIRMVTHSAKDSDLRRAIAVIDALDTVREVNSVIRVESEKH